MRVVSEQFCGYRIITILTLFGHQTVQTVFYATANAFGFGVTFSLPFCKFELSSCREYSVFFLEYKFRLPVDLRGKLRPKVSAIL